MSFSYGNFGFLNLDELQPAPFLLLDFGIEKRCLELYDWDNRRRPDYGGYLFQYTLRGLGKLEWNGQTRPLPAGSAFLTAIPEDSRYFLPEEAGEGGWEILYLHFSGSGAAPFYEKIRELPSPVFTLDPDSIPISLLLGLHRTMQSGASLQKYEGGEILCRFLSSLLRELERPACALRQPYIELACRKMRERYASLSGIQEIAGELGVSLPHFTRTFHQETGMTPIRFLTNLRLEHAIHLLLNTDASMEQIAADCGFSCANYFAKVFRKAMHTSPADYRRQRGR